MAHKEESGVVTKRAAKRSSELAHPKEESGVVMKRAAKRSSELGLSGVNLS